jgi:steroid delta-isomerase
VPTADDIREVIEAYRAAAAATDVDAYLALFADDAVMQDPVPSPPLEGTDAIREFMANAFSLVETIDIAPEDVIVCGDEAVMVSTMRSVMPTATMQLHLVHHWTFDVEGRIRKMRVFWDPATANWG